MRFGSGAFLTAAMAACLATAPANAQDATANWPSKNIRLIIPASPGGVADAIARLLADGMGKRLHATFVPENIAGAASVVGLAAAAKAAPDGHTLVITAIAPVGILPIVRTLPYDVEKDLAPVGLISTQPHLLAVHPSVPANNLKEFIALLKANPDKYNYGSSGAGQLNNLEMELLLLKIGSKMAHVPYKSSGDQATALIGGHIHAAAFGTTAALPHIRTGKVRALATFSAERYPELPDLPTVDEVVPGFGSAFSWHGLMAPAGTPKPIIDKIHAAMKDYVLSPEGRAAFAKIGADPVGASPKALMKQIRDESKVWAGVIKATGIKIE